VPHTQCKSHANFPKTVKKGPKRPGAQAFFWFGETAGEGNGIPGF